MQNTKTRVGSPKPRSPRKRRGSLMTEVLVAAALFTTALISLGKLAQISAKVNLEADQRLSARLIGENVIDRFRVAKVSDFDDLKQRIKQAEFIPGGYRVDVTTRDFKVANKDAIGLKVVVSTDGKAFNYRAELNDWRLPDQMKQPAEAE